MKLTIKNLEKRYNIQINSIMNFEKGIRMWMIEYQNKKLYFDNKEELKEFLERAEEGK